MNSMQKVSVQDRTVHKMYLKLVKNQPETIWADYVVTDECVGCGICMKVCPKKALRFKIPEVNLEARYRNEHISLSELVEANNQTD